MIRKYVLEETTSQSLQSQFGWLLVLYNMWPKGKFMGVDYKPRLSLWRDKHSSNKAIFCVSCALGSEPVFMQLHFIRTQLKKKKSWVLCFSVCVVQAHAATGHEENLHFEAICVGSFVWTWQEVMADGGVTKSGFWALTKCVHKAGRIPTVHTGWRALWQRIVIVYGQYLLDH